jgi:putative lipoprotein
MKMKKTFAIILSSSLLLGASSCRMTEEDIWEDSSAERMNKTLVEYKNDLCAETEGWVLQYFANESEPAYPILMKFSPNSAVIMAAKNSVATNNVYVEDEEPTAYTLIGDMGPVLSFNTYNPLLHCFSDPQQDGKGHLGDYEFVINGKNTDGSFDLRGKKHGVGMKMIKFPKGATYTVGGETKTIEKWEDYYTAYNAVKNQLFPSKAKAMYLTAGEESYKVTGMGGGVLSIVNTEVSAESYTFTCSYVIGVDATVSLSSPFTGDNNKFKVQNFKLNEAGILECTDEGQVATISAGTVAEYFLADGMVWRLDRNQMSDQYKTLFNQMQSDCQKAGYGSLQYLQYGWNATENKMAFTFKTNKFEGEFYFDSTIEGDNVVTLAFNQEATEASSSSKASNAMVFYRQFESFRNMVSLISTKFTLEGNSPLAVTSITMTDAAGNSVVVSLN